MSHYDIVIVGAGIAGSALAYALSSSTTKAGEPLTIAIVEKRPLPTGAVPLDEGVDGYDLRASALTNNTINWLSDIGIWAQVQSQRSSEFVDMEVWVEEGTGKISFGAAEVGESALGEVVENRVLTASLINSVRALDNVAIIDGVEVTDLASGPLVKSENAHLGSAEATLSLDNGQSISADLVVAADGAYSPLRELLDIPVRAWEYGHDAIVCTVQMEKPHHATAYQRFTRYGPVAFLPLESSTADASICTIVWSQDKARAAELLALDEGDFCRELAAAIEYRLGDVKAVSQRQAFPLRQMHALEYTRPNVVLVADAAHTIHPLAGQGINLGLADVAELVKTINEALEAEKLISDERLLKRYQRRRKTGNLAMMAIMEGFKRIYQPLPLPAMLLRNEGMNFLDKHYLLKQKIIRYAMGVE